MSEPQEQSTRSGLPRWGGRTALLAACASIAAGGLLAGCGGDDEEPAGAGSTSTSAEAPESEAPAEESAAGGSTDQVEIVEFLYEPEAITVAAGTEVTWTNADAAPHTATADDSSFDTDTLDKGDSGSATFDEPGTYSYYCRFHAFMKGTVEVE